MGNDWWLHFVSFVAVVIHVMQTFERAVIRLIEIVVLYPLRRILHTYQNYDSSMVEYYSATCALAFSAWMVLGKTGQAYYRHITDEIPWWAWALSSALIGFSQGVSVHRGDGTTRAMLAALSLALWLWITAITLRHIGYAAMHAFSAPLMLAMWLTIFMQLRGGDAARTE